MVCIANKTYNYKSLPVLTFINIKHTEGANDLNNIFFFATDISKVFL